MEDNNQSSPPQVKSSNFDKPFYIKYKLPVQIISWAITVLLVWWGYNSFFANKQGTACTLEAKICPDGSSVGRTGPKCEFAPCPSASPQGKPIRQAQGKPTDATANWKTYENTKQEYSIRYPEELKIKELSNGDLNIYFPEDETPGKYIYGYKRHLALYYRTPPLEEDAGEPAGRPQQKVSINNATGIKITDMDLDYFLTNEDNSKVVRIVYIAIGINEQQDEKKQKLEVFDQILQTFTFD